MISLQQAKDCLAEFEKINEEYLNSQESNHIKDIYGSTIDILKKFISNYVRFPVSEKNEVESILMLKSGEVVPVFLTAQERKALEAMLDDDYISGDMTALGYDWSVAEVIASACNITTHAAAGVIGSLCKKRMLLSYEDTLSYTVYGREWLMLYCENDPAVQYEKSIVPDAKDVAADINQLMKIADLS